MALGPGAIGVPGGSLKAEGLGDGRCTGLRRPRGTRTWLFVLRSLGYAAFIGEAVVVLAAVAFLCRAPGYLGWFFLGLAPILILFHLLPIAVSWHQIREVHQVRKEGDSWTAGRYSEAQVRTLARQCGTVPSANLQKMRIVVADYRGTGGWTWLSLLWPGRRARKTICISAGALHYLEPDELQGLIAHEMGHHDRANRCDAPGGCLAADLALFSLLFLSTAPAELKDIVPIWLTLLPLRMAVAWIVIRLQSGSERMIEHLCDLYAARYVGREPVVNMLLKLGEEEELTEVVVARAAGELSYARDTDLEDLASTFEKVRPYGRISHDNLFRRASQIASLCETLRDHPDRALFLCDSERDPTSHPSFRDRILLLVSAQMAPAADPYPRPVRQGKGGFKSC